MKKEAFHLKMESLFLFLLSQFDLDRAEHLAVGGGHTLVEAHPLTGRTHQLRVHFASVGHPITGDDLYGSPSSVIDRHALHAHSLSFPHPKTQERMTLTAPLPADMKRLIEAFFPEYISTLA